MTADSLAIWRPDGELRVGVALVDGSELAGYRELMRRGIDELDDVERSSLLRTSMTGHVALP